MEAIPPVDERMKPEQQDETATVTCASPSQQGSPRTRPSHQRKNFCPRSPPPPFCHQQRRRRSKPQTCKQRRRHSGGMLSLSCRRSSHLSHCQHDCTSQPARALPVLWNHSTQKRPRGSRFGLVARSWILVRVGLVGPPQMWLLCHCFRCL